MLQGSLGKGGECVCRGVSMYAARCVVCVGGGGVGGAVYKLQGVMGGGQPVQEPYNADT